MPRVLVADDTRDVADIYCFILSAVGYDVARAYDGVTALALAKATKPDALVLNYGMPTMSGLDVLRELNASGFRAKTIITSATAAFPDLEAKAAAAGAYACLQLPCPPERLTKLLARAVAPRAGA